MILRPQQLPPEIAGTYNTNIASETTEEIFELDRGPYNGVVIYVKSSHELKIHVDAGTMFGVTTEYLNRRTYTAAANVGCQFPVECACEKILVSAENPGEAATTELHIATYLSTVGGIPLIQHPAVTLWSNQTLTAGAADVFSPIVDLSNSLGGQLFVEVTNGTTGPTAAPRAWLQGSSDGVNFGDYCSLGGISGLSASLGKLTAYPTTSNAVTRQSVAIPHTIAFGRIRAGGNTGQNVTISASANLAHY